MAVLRDRPYAQFNFLVDLGTGSTELYDWRRQIIAGKEDRRDVTIQQLEGPDGRVTNSWRLTAAWPCRWSGPAFNALQSGIAYEELELDFDDLIWLKPANPTQGD